MIIANNNDKFEQTLVYQSFLNSKPAENTEFITRQANITPVFFNPIVTAHYNSISYINIGIILGA